MGRKASGATESVMVRLTPDMRAHLGERPSDAIRRLIIADMERQDSPADPPDVASEPPAAPAVQDAPEPVRQGEPVASIARSAPPAARISDGSRCARCVYLHRLGCPNCPKPRPA